MSLRYVAGRIFLTGEKYFVIFVTKALVGDPCRKQLS